MGITARIGESLVHEPASRDESHVHRNRRTQAVLTDRCTGSQREIVEEIRVENVNLEDFAQQYTGSQAAIEATSNYYHTYDTLSECLDVTVANPSKLKLISDTDKKTDRVDAKQLARMLRLGSIPESYVPTGEVFDCDKEVVSYVGLNPVIHESGDSRFEGNISKRGSGRVRWLLVQSSDTAVHTCQDEYLSRFYNRLSQRKSSKKAIVATVRKLVVSKYHMLD